jgi:hypothetical protein
MVEHNGYMISQMSDGDVTVYKDGRFYLHANMSGYLEEEELIENVESIIKMMDEMRAKEKEFSN